VILLAEMKEMKEVKEDMEAKTTYCTLKDGW
jgi:hypothetical protein